MPSMDSRFDETRDVNIASLNVQSVTGFHRTVHHDKNGPLNTGDGYLLFQFRTNKTLQFTEDGQPSWLFARMENTIPFVASSILFLLHMVQVDHGLITDFTVVAIHYWTLLRDAGESKGNKDVVLFVCPHEYRKCVAKIFLLLSPLQ